jgi:hypothetical protein
LPDQFGFASTARKPSLGFLEIWGNRAVAISFVPMAIRCQNQRPACFALGIA